MKVKRMRHARVCKGEATAAAELIRMRVGTAIGVQAAGYQLKPNDYQVGYAMNIITAS